MVGLCLGPVPTYVKMPFRVRSSSRCCDAAVGDGLLPTETGRVAVRLVSH